MKKKELVLTCQPTSKAKEKMKKGMMKVISNWSPSLAAPKFPDGQVFICVLDSDKTRNTTHEGAEQGIENSLKNLPNHKLLCFDGVIWQTVVEALLENQRRQDYKQRDSFICLHMLQTAHVTTFNLLGLLQ
jgi:hypothetical protein